MPIKSQRAQQSCVAEKDQKFVGLNTLSLSLSRCMCVCVYMCVCVLLVRLTHTLLLSVLCEGLQIKKGRSQVNRYTSMCVLYRDLYFKCLCVCFCYILSTIIITLLTK